LSTQVDVSSKIRVRVRVRVRVRETTTLPWHPPQHRIPNPRLEVSHLAPAIRVPEMPTMITPQQYDGVVYIPMLGQCIDL
jgi:hypothetical protein